MFHELAINCRNFSFSKKGRSNCAGRRISFRMGGEAMDALAGSVVTCAYDANGNITEYVSGSGEILSHCDYSAFGRELVQSGCDDFIHRFSTKPYCRNTGMLEYQLRRYRPRCGRWMNRDAIEEEGGLNLYGYVGNASIYKFDYLGLDNPGCDIVGAIPFFENNCRLNCCAAHDECYDMNGCKASSWFSTVNPFSRCTPCDQCNKDVVTCINDCFWNGDPDPNNEEKIYYCARQHKYISIGEGKDFATKKEATEACSSR